MVAQAKPTAKFGGLPRVFIEFADAAPVAASHACGDECQHQGALTDGNEMEMHGTSTRFTGAVLGGLRTSLSRTFRTSGTAVVVAQGGTEHLLIAESARVGVAALL